MPKTRITETDLTGVPSLGTIPNVVYIPGAAAEHVDAILYTTPKAFEEAFGVNSTIGYFEDLSAKMAHHLLKLGMQVLYEGFPAVNGDCGEITGITMDKDVWLRLQDKSLYDIRFLTTGGYWMPSTEMITCAAKRCDAVALLDTKELEVDSIRLDLDLMIESAKGTASPITSDATSFAAVFVPTLKMNVIDLDNVLEALDVPASFGYLVSYATSVQENPLWYAVAGAKRGSIPGLISVAKEYTNAECERLQARAKEAEVDLDDDTDNVGIAYNPIAFRRNFGYVIWGNRTTKLNLAGVGLKATSFLNCRLLETEVAKVAYNTAIRYTFEQNNSILWTNFVSGILPTLDKMESGNGVLDFKITRVPTTAKARLAAKIQLVPIEGVEDFDINIEMTDEISVTE